MALEVVPLIPGFAARFEGVDAANPSDRDIAAMKDAMIDYTVVVLPRQDLSEEAQVAFGERFGPLDSNGQTSKEYNRGMRTDLLSVSNAGDGDRPATIDDRRRLLDIGNKLWHSDSSFKAVTARYSMLYGLQVASVGGETQFADMRAAYDALSDEWKAMIADLVAEHCSMHSRVMLGFDGWTGERRQAVAQSHAHDLVRVIPETGRKSLYLSAHAERVIGLPLPVGRMLLHELTELATQPEHVYTHRWERHDLVIWDNSCTLHRARRYRAATEVRAFRRVTTLDTRFPERDIASVNVPEWVVEAAG